jgi:chromosome segregation ATPase
LRTANAAAQRAQILIYRVQVQEAVVTRLQERIDGMRSTLSQTEHEGKRIADAIKQNEDVLDKAENEASRKEIEQVIPQLKSALEMETSNEQEIRAKLAAAEEQLREEQAKLGRLEDELDRLDKALESSSH